MPDIWTTNTTTVPITWAGITGSTANDVITDYTRHWQQIAVDQPRYEPITTCIFCGSSEENQIVCSACKRIFLLLRKHVEEINDVEEWLHIVQEKDK